MANRRHKTKNNVLKNIDEIVRAESVQSYLKAAEKYKPLSIRLLGSGFLTSIVDVVLHSGAGDYRDSLTVPAQVPAVYALLSEFPNKDVNILYVASSYGLGMKLIKEAGYQNVEGIDIDLKALTFCLEQGLNATFMNATHMDFEDGKFDLTISRDLIDFIYLEPEEEVHAINEQYRVLKPGGSAIFTSMVDIGTHGYIGMPPDYAIQNSSFRDSRMREIVLSIGFWEGRRMVPIRIYQK